MYKTPLLVGLLAVVGFVSPCSAQTPPPPPKDVDVDMMAREYRDAPVGAGALTKEMIEACVRLKIDLEKDDAELDALREKVKKLNDEVKHLGAYLKNNKGQFDENDTSAARREYQAKVKEYNSRIPLLKELTQSYGDMLKPYKDKEGKFEQECNSQPYYEDDYKEIEEKLGRGM
ncbi:MAG: hypothetical protein ACL93V_11430 [Candidatus Electrothrix sp. YB6]